MDQQSLTAKGQETRQKIVLEARKLLITAGPGGVVMREVAKCCGIKLGNVQYYFANREALLVAIISREAEQDVALMQGFLESKKSPKKIWQSVVTGLIQRWRGESAIVFSALNLFALHDSSFRAIYGEIYADHYGVLEQVIGLISPGVPPRECARRARLMSALIDGAAYQTEVGPRSSFLADVVHHSYNIATGGDLAAIKSAQGNS